MTVIVLTFLFQDEIHQNVDKLHGEMGFAEWIVYFIYGAFVAIVLAVVLLLMLLKVSISFFVEIY